MPQAPIFIAEASSNHGRDLARALAFVDAAADAGCDAVKFQLFKIDRMFAPEILARSAKHRARREWELPLAHLAPLAERCLKRGIQFSCTPFYLEAVEELRPFVAFYKIASYELLVSRSARGLRRHRQTRRALHRHGDDGGDRAGRANAESARAHPTSRCCIAYRPIRRRPRRPIFPPSPTIRDATGCPAGWSDHTRRPAVIERAVHRWGAAAVEFHLDLDGEGAEYAAGHCWLPQEIAPVIARIRESLVADGNGLQGAAAVRTRRPRMARRSGRRHAPAAPCPRGLGTCGMSTREHLRIVAVIQARMGSTRLPGKVLKPVAGQPLLWHIVHRLKASHLIEEIAIATTTNPRDDAIVEFGQAHGVTVVRGPEDDVLARFACAAETLDADIIVRVSSDAPFIDAGFVDHLVASHDRAGWRLRADGRRRGHRA